VNTLILSHNKILELSDLNQLTNLQKLSLSWNQIGAISDALQNNTALTELRIRGNQISRIPPGIAENVHLRVLDVANNTIEDKRGLQAICSLKHLRNLHIKGNPVALEPGINEWLRQQIPTLKLLEGKNVENTKFTEKSLIKKGKKESEPLSKKRKNSDPNPQKFREESLNSHKRQKLKKQTNRVEKEIISEILGAKSVETKRNVPKFVKLDEKTLEDTTSLEEKTTQIESEGKSEPEKEESVRKNTLMDFFEDPLQNVASW